jgi:hypothetical protein
MKRISALVALASVTCGCSVTADGIGPAHHAQDASQVAQLRTQLQENAASADAKETSPQPGLIVIGTTGPFRSIEDKDRPGFYAAYVKVSGQWHPGEPPSMDADTFQGMLAGWASIQVSGIPGIMSVRLRMLVPTSVLHETQFSSAAGSFLFGTTGDLVVARTDHDSLLWLERVLCRDDRTYHDCAKSYQLGVYDENTGRALDRDRKPKVNGGAVNLTTYMKDASPQ